MNKWMKIGGIAVTVIVVGATVLAAAALAKGAARGFRGGPFFDKTDGAAFMGFGGPRGFGPGGIGFFAGEDGHGPRWGHRRGTSGKVTAVDDDSLTLQTGDGDSVAVNLNDDIRVMLAETQSEGSLDDVTMGSTVSVMGRKNDDGSVDARGIVVLPAGDHAGGRVTAVNGSTITVNGRDGEATIVVDDNTTYRLGRDETGSLADVSEEKLVVAFGQQQEDGSLSARLVLIREFGRMGHRGGLGEDARMGEVTAVDSAAGSFTLDTLRGGTVTVQTAASTTYRTRSQAEVSFDDITAGSRVFVAGRPVEEPADTILAEVVGIKK